MVEIYIDESGDTNVSAKASETYVVVGIVCPERSQSKVISALDSIAKEHFSGGVIKSSNIKNDHARRVNVVSQLRGLEFRFGSLSVHKQLLNKLESPGFYHKKSFYKYFNRSLLEKWHNYLTNAKIFVDDYGSEVFKASVVAKLQKDLPMLTQEIYYIKDEDSRLIQLADLIAGTLAKWNSFTDDQRNAIELALGTKSSFKDVFPPTQLTLVSDWDYLKVDPELSSKFREMYLTYINRHKTSEDLAMKLGSSILNYLLDTNSVDPFKRVFAPELIRYLQVEHNWSGNNEQFRKIIGKLRENAIVISTSRSGYKMPSSSEDITRYAKSTLSKVTPMLRRLKKCRDVMVLNGKNDPLQKEIIEELRRYL